MRETFPVVRWYDPAFREAGVDFAAAKRYAKSRDPKDLPQLPPGATQPITFHCRDLTRDQLFDFVELAGNQNRKHGRAFAAGVVRVTGGRFGEAPGWMPEGADRSGYQAMTDSELDALGVAFADILDVGSIIYLRSVSPKDCELRYPLQLTSLAVWEGYDYLSAAQNQRSAPPNSGERKEG